MDLGGISCIVSDTAGLREETEDPIEKEGIRRAREAFKSAQLRIFVCDSSNMASVESGRSMLQALTTEEQNEEQNEENRSPKLPQTQEISDGNRKSDSYGEYSKPGSKDYSQRSAANKVIVVWNKADLLQDKSKLSVNPLGPSMFMSDSMSQQAISCINGDGLKELEDLLTSTIKRVLDGGESGQSIDEIGKEDILITRERHRRHLTNCAEHLDAFLWNSLPMDAAAEELRLAMLELGKITVNYTF